MTTSADDMEYEKKPTNPTIDEMRRVAFYMRQTMGLYSAAGKLMAKADKLERIVQELMELKND